MSKAAKTAVDIISGEGGGGVLNKVSITGKL